MVNNGSKMEITSNVANRLKKIREGSVYASHTSFIDELIQNAQRAKATECHIIVDVDTFIIRDNGIGCPNPKTLFTLDVSGFGVGFGEGFTSIYHIADEFYVHTLDWTGQLNIIDALRKEDLTVTIKKNAFIQGFELVMKGRLIEKYNYEIQESVINIAQYIPDIKFTLNNEIIGKQELLTFNYLEIERRFSNRMYDGVIGILPSHQYGRIKIYHDYRYVTHMDLEGAEGTILLKPNAVTLRTPDRKDIIYDTKRSKLTRTLFKDVQYLTKELLKENDSSLISRYANTIENYLNVEDYINFLSIEESAIPNQYEVRNKKNESINTDDDIENQDEQEQNTVNQNHNTSNVQTAKTTVNRPSNNSTASNKDNRQLQEQVDTRRVQEDTKFNSYVYSEAITKEELKNISIKNIKNKKNVIWVEKEREHEFHELIVKYEYYGVFTFVSPHILYNNALRFMAIPHISTVEDHAIEKQYEVKRTGAKNKKEERIMEILFMIEQYLNLKTTFFISDIKCNMRINLRGTKIYQQPFPIHGYAKGSVIHLNRKSLKMGKISSILLHKPKIGIHDIKFIMNNLELISHELSHVIYNTKDNTMEHYEGMLKIQNDIADFISNQE